MLMSAWEANIRGAYVFWHSNLDLENFNYAVYIADKIGAVHYHEAGHAVVATVLRKSTCKWAIISSKENGEAETSSDLPTHDAILTLAGPLAEAYFTYGVNDDPVTRKVKKAEIEKASLIDSENLEIGLRRAYGRWWERRAMIAAEFAVRLLEPLLPVIATVAGRLQRQGWVAHHELVEVLDADKTWIVPRDLRGLVKRKYRRRKRRTA